jgi:CubicO group peptidase (beta-lactamase class C family)
MNSKTAKRVSQALIVSMTALLMFSCGKNVTSIPDIEPPPAPIVRDDGWAVSSLEEQGINPARIAHISQEIRNGDFEEIHAMLIVRNGYLVFEEYYLPGHGIGELHRLASVTKSIISALVGIAIYQGFIESHNQPLYELFPDMADIFDADPEKRDLTVRHALTMTSGLRWKEGIGGDPDSDAYTMDHHTNSVRFILSKPLDRKPGRRFQYTSLPTVMAGAIENTSGIAVDSFTVQYLFAPLGIGHHRWEYQSDGMVRADGGLHMTARDLAKFGLLYLQEGVWNGNRLLPENWTELSSREWIWAGGNYYGFFWWLRPSSSMPGFRMPSEGIYFASGYGGQKLFVVPDYNMVVVFYGNDSWAKEDDDRVPHFIMYNILESAEE